jgi:hypothetical protein
MTKHFLRLLAFACVGLVTISGCAADSSDDDPDADDEEATGQVDEQLLAGRRIPQREVASILRDVGFPNHVVNEMVCTAKYESSFYERASNRNGNGSIDRGLFQINSIHLGRAGCPSRSNAGALYHARTNAKCALQVYRSQGLNAWYGYQYHRSECNGYRLP